MELEYSPEYENNEYLNYVKTIRNNNEKLCLVCMMDENEIKDNIIWEKRWKTISLTFTILKYVCLVSVPVFSLSSPYFYNYSVLLSYLSGSLASISLGFERLAKLSFNISKSKQEKINELMKKLNINFKINDVEIKTNDTKENIIMTPKHLKRNFSMNS